MKRNKLMDMMKRSTLLCASLVAAFSMSSCDSDVFDINSDPFKGQTYANLLNSPISSYLETEADFSEYVKALKYSNLFNALNQSSNGTSFSAFVPNNDAMFDFYKRRGVDSLVNLNKDYVRSFVLYHTVKDSILPEDFINKDFITNLTGNDITIKLDSMNAGQATLNGEGQVIKMGIAAYNGNVYVMSKAMTPLVETVWDRLVEVGGSSIMQQAITAAGLSKTLNTVSDTTYQDGAAQINKSFFTLLNVSDAVFAQAGINSLEGLKAKLMELDSRGLSADSLLREYVGYHIVGNMYKVSELGGKSGSSDTRLWNTISTNQVFTVTTDTLASSKSDMYVINALGTSAKFNYEASNVVARNGYLHQLSSWLPVWVPQPETVVWDFADYADVKSVVPSSEYQPSTPFTNDMVTSLSNASCYTYEVGGAGSANTTYSPVAYVACAKNWKDANNCDRVVFNVGAQGSVEMASPTIIRGKYKVELTFAYTASLSFMRTQSGSNGGRLIVTFDDKNQIETAPYTTVSSIMPGMYKCTLYDEIEFDETSSHKFKFIVNDQAASTNKNFSLQFDCLTFTPIK